MKPAGAQAGAARTDRVSGTFPVEDARADGEHARIREAIDERRDEVRVEPHVVVQHDRDVLGARRDDGVQREEEVVDRADDDLDLRKSLARECHARVGTSVVDQNHAATSAP